MNYIIFDTETDSGRMTADILDICRLFFVTLVLMLLKNLIVKHA